MAWEIEFTDEFGMLWEALDESAQEKTRVSVMLLREFGPNLDFPHSSKIVGSKLGGLRELRIQHKGDPYRILYVFDPRRVGILLLGGCKSGDDRWYEIHVPKAEKVYDDYLEELKKEGLI